MFRVVDLFPDWLNSKTLLLDSDMQSLAAIVWSTEMEGADIGERLGKNESFEGLEVLFQDTSLKLWHTSSEFKWTAARAYAEACAKAFRLCRSFKELAGPSWIYCGSAPLNVHNAAARGNEIVLNFLLEAEVNGLDLQLIPLVTFWSRLFLGFSRFFVLKTKKRKNTLVLRFCSVPLYFRRK